MRFGFCNKSRKRIKVLSEQLDRLQMENDNLYSQNNELRIQMNIVDNVDKSSHKLSRKRETLRPLSRSRSRLLSRSRSRSSSADSKIVYECGILAKENTDLKNRYKNLYDEYQKYKKDCEDSKSSLRDHLHKAHNLHKEIKKKYEDIKTHKEIRKPCEEKNCWSYL